MLPVELFLRCACQGDAAHVRLRLQAGPICNGPQMLRDTAQANMQ